MKLILKNLTIYPLSVAGRWVIPASDILQVEIDDLSLFYEIESELKILSEKGVLQYDLDPPSTASVVEGKEETDSLHILSYDPETDSIYYRNPASEAGGWKPVGSSYRLSHFDSVLYDSNVDASPITQDAVKKNIARYMGPNANDLGAADEYAGGLNWAELLGVVYWDLWTDTGKKITAQRYPTFENLYAQVQNLVDGGASIVWGYAYSQVMSTIKPLSRVWAGNALYLGIRNGTWGMRKNAHTVNEVSTTSQYPWYGVIRDLIWNSFWPSTPRPLDPNEAMKVVWIDRKMWGYDPHIPGEDAILSPSSRYYIDVTSGNINPAGNIFKPQSEMKLLYYPDPTAGDPSGSGPVLMEWDYSGKGAQADQVTLTSAVLVIGLVDDTNSNHQAVILRPFGIDTLSFTKWSDDLSLEAMLYLPWSKPRVRTLPSSDPNIWTSGGRNSTSHSPYLWVDKAFDKYDIRKFIRPKKINMVRDNDIAIHFYLRQTGTPFISPLSDWYLTLRSLRTQKGMRYSMPRLWSIVRK